jgi:small conductance mechanosensitive channel
LKKRFDELGIEIPFPHRTIYFANPLSTGPLDGSTLSSSSPAPAPSKPAAAQLDVSPSPAADAPDAESDR